MTMPHLCYGLLGLLCIVPTIGATPPQSRRPRAATPAPAAAPNPVLDNLCGDLGAFAVQGTARYAQGWSITQALAEIEPMLTSFSPALGTVYRTAVHYGYSPTAPETIRTVMVRSCYRDPDMLQHAQELAAYLATRQPPPPDRFTQWLQICAAIAAQAEHVVRARDSGHPPHHRRAWQHEAAAISPDMQGILATLALDIYRWTHWDTVIARREAEGRCMGHAPRD